MNIGNVEKLLGGYATGTLTDEERRLLFEAALTNQNLFDALADEQALKELLDDPVCRRQLLERLEQRRTPAWARLNAWLRRPSTLALAGTVAAGVVIVAVVRQNQAPPAVAVKPIASAPAAVSPPPMPEPVPPPVRQATRQPKVRKEAPAKQPEQPEPALVAQAPPPPPPAPAKELAPAPQPVPEAVTVGPPLAAEKEAKARPEMSQTVIVRPAPRASAEATRTNVPTARELYYAQSSAVSGFAPRVAAPRQAPAGGVVGGVAGFRAPAPGVRYSILQEGKEADPQAVFSPGAALEVRLEPNEDGYLTLLSRDATGEWKPLFQNRVRSRTPYLVPIRLDERPGDRKLRVIFSRQPQAATVSNVEAEAAAPAVLHERADRMTYVVGMPRPPDARVSFEITLTAR